MAIDLGCPQCGLIHPILKPGELCTVAAAKDQQNKENDKFSSHIILGIQSVRIKLTQKGETLTEKSFKKLIMEVYKVIDGYVAK